jgi:hypothetical protein
MKAARTPGFLIYMGGYAALLAWFKLADVYHTHFATKGLIVVVYNAFRVLFIFYLFWIVYAVGALALRRFGKFSELQTIERLVLGFFAGTGLWHIALLALGYLNLYTVPVAIAVTLPAVALAYSDARDALSEWWRCWRSLPWQKCLGAAAIALAGGLLLLFKGLYPGGGHDYYTHYFYYYQSVIEHGGIWPNEVWYHYFYSKGCGLFFLGMLLSDPLAPQLVTFCFMAVAAAALYLTVKAIAPETNWPIASVLLFLSIYLFTPGWGEFEKDHEFKTALIIAIIWLTQRAFGAQKPDVAKFIFACGSAVAAAVIINTQIGLYFVAVFTLVALVFIWSPERRNAVICLALAAWAGAIVIGILVLNYATAGLPLDQGITLVWPFADVEKLYRSGSLPMVMHLHRGTKSLIAQGMPFFSAETLKLVVKSFRLDLLYPLIISGIGIAGVSILIQRKDGLLDRWKFARASQFHILTVVSACAVTLLIVCLTTGRVQPVSFHRYSAFAVPIAILTGIILWTIVPSSKTRIADVVKSRGPPIVVVVCLFAIAVDVRLNRYRDALTTPLAFVTGAKSIDDAFVSRGRWPYHLPWGAIYPAARAAYEIVGPRTPIWSLHIHSYCMLPDCQIETYFSFNMTDRWDRVMFGTADEARQLLQRAGINYFLYSRELAGPGLGITDPLPLSALFSPDHIAKYLALRWTDGTTSLLTWPGPDTRPLDDAWIAAYRHGVNNSSTVKKIPLAAVRETYERYYAMPHPWKPIPLPW